MKDILAAPLTHLFNKSLREHVVPDTWKTANVTPVFKMKGSKYKTDNYRPISLTSICCRLMESQIKNAIIKHLDQNDIIKDSQHGFTTRRSAVTNLLEYLEKVTSNVDQGKPVDVIYLDLSKAFDKVPHRRLIKILRDYRIDEEVIRWIEIWLNERKQRVVLNGKTSNWELVLSGVPQGSVLGPLLFIIYVNPLDDIILNLANIVSKYADDTKVGSMIEDDEDHNKLQEALDKINQWAEDWQMKFNEDKCKVIHFGQTNKQREYKLNNKIIQKSNC